MKYAFFAQNRHVPAILLVSAVVFVAIWWSYPHIAESAHTRAEPVAIQPLIAPAGFTAAEDNKDTAFPDQEAGFSAYHRVDTSQEGESERYLRIKTIASGLTSAPEDSEIRKAGNLDELGLNFGIVELPMYAAVIPSAPTENVTVYFDDQGWIVAYLPKGRPAAAIWKYTSMGDTTDETKLKNNLLVLAINEVLEADGAATISPDDVKYYDWEDEKCNAFVLFSTVAKEGGKSDPVKFVVPKTITEIGASAAVVITEVSASGDGVTASVVVDDERVSSAYGDNPRHVGGFKLARETNHDGSHKTSLHEVVVYVTPDNMAAGVVMLVYAKPSAN